MKLTYLGTGGGGGIPELFCSCDICRNSRLVKGRELRNRCMALINDDLCIDLPCDARNSMLTHNVNPRNLKYILITHKHYDHFMPENFINRPEGTKKIELFISRGSGQDFAELCSKYQGKLTYGLRPVNIPDIHFIAPFETVNIGRYMVTAIPANHDRAIECLNFIISDTKHTVLWLHDTGILLNETWNYLKEKQLEFDLVSIDCSFPYSTHSQTEHMNIQQCKELTVNFLDLGYLKKTGVVYLSHISHNVNLTHMKLEMEASKSNLYVAYDGLCVEI